MERQRRRRRRHKSSNNQEGKEIPKKVKEEKMKNEKTSSDEKPKTSQRSRNRRRSDDRAEKKEKDQIKKPINDFKYEEAKPNLLAELKAKIVDNGPLTYTEDDYIRYRFSISEKYHDFKSLVYMTNSVDEARQCIILFPKLKVFSQEGILAYPQPPINAKNGYSIRLEKSNKEIDKQTSLTSAITSCKIGMIVTDQNGNRVY